MSSAFLGLVFSGPSPYFACLVECFSSSKLSDFQWRWKDLNSYFLKLPDSWESDHVPNSYKPWKKTGSPFFAPDEFFFFSPIFQIEFYQSKDAFKIPFLLECRGKYHLQESTCLLAPPLLVHNISEFKVGTHANV